MPQHRIPSQFRQQFRLLFCLAGPAQEPLQLVFVLRKKELSWEGHEARQMVYADSILYVYI